MQNLDKLKIVLQDYDFITVLGHDNIDVDAFLSGILLSRLLNFIGVKNEFLILEKVQENETFHIVKDMIGIDMKEYQDNAESSVRKIFLIDHYSTEHEGEVIACLDHHLTTDTVVSTYQFYYSKKSCSASYIVYELMCEAGYQISKEEAKMLLVSMMIDTVSFKSKKTVQDEVIEARKIANFFGLNFEEIQKSCFCLTPIDKLSVKEIVENGLKNYNYNGNKVKSSYIQVYEKIEEKVIKIWLNEIIKKIKNNNLAMWVFIIFDCKNEVTIEYHITVNSVTHVETAGILSRGTNIMPLVEVKFS